MMDNEEKWRGVGGEQILHPPFSPTRSSSHLSVQFRLQSCKNSKEVAGVGIKIAG